MATKMAVVSLHMWIAQYKNVFLMNNVGSLWESDFSSFFYFIKWKLIKSYFISISYIALLLQDGNGTFIVVPMEKFSYIGVSIWTQWACKNPHHVETGMH